MNTLSRAAESSSIRLFLADILLLWADFFCFALYAFWIERQKSILYFCRTSFCRMQILFLAESTRNNRIKKSNSGPCRIRSYKVLFLSLYLPHPFQSLENSEKPIIFSISEKKALLPLCTI